MQGERLRFESGSFSEAAGIAQKGFLRVPILLVVLWKGAALLALVIVAGCGSSMTSNKPEPAERHLTYEKSVGEKGIWIADVDGSHPRLLVRGGQMPSISPDGKWVAYSVECAPSKVGCTYVIATSGGKPRLLSTRSLDEITWSPSSERIVGAEYQADEDLAELVSIDVASGDAVTLARAPSVGGWSFSPDGKRIVFDLGDASYVNYDLYVVTASGGEPQRITDTRDSELPVWGPDAVAFHKDAAKEEEIWRIQPDGSDARRIARDPPSPLGGYAFVPVAWSVDGHALLARVDDVWGEKPVGVNPENGTVSEVGGYGPPGGVAPIALSRDGRWVLIEKGSRAEVPPEDWTVLIAPYEGGKTSVVASGATAPSWNR